MKHSEYLNKMRWKIRLLSWFKIPLLAYVSPRLTEINDQQASIQIKLRRRTKNHLNSMYFGALTVGADLCAGLHAFYYADRAGRKISFAFKAMSAEFLKRAESDVTFICRDGRQIETIFNQALATGERINQEVTVNAYDLEQTLVAKFQMTISIKVI